MTRFNTLVIGDLHGKNFWRHLIWKEEHLNKKPFKKIIFLGDYVDCFYTPNEVQRQNLLDLIEFKKQNPDRVILLWGNHDIHYLFPQYKCSGYSQTRYNLFHPIFKENELLFQVAYEGMSDGKTVLFTHAGISKKWLALPKIEEAFNFFKEFDHEGLAEILNGMFGSRYMNELMMVGPMRGGSDDYAGPIWADKYETCFEIPDNLIQYVGHTPVDPETRATSYTNSERINSIFYCDTLDFSLDVCLLNLDLNK